MFRSWLNRLPESIEIVAVRLPGRDARIKEPAFSDWPDLLNAMELALAPYFDHRFAFFGHSLGGSVAYELAQRLHNQKKIPLTQLIISGCQCPHIPRRKPPMHHLPKQEFLERLHEMNGTPPEVLKDKVLMALLEPTLRADIKLAETWKCSTREPLNIPITAFSGLMDEVAPPPDMQDWKHYTNAQFSFYKLTGNHFFIHTSEEMLVRIISSVCNSV
jgi:surfactin synthase thioesterase subunit